MPLIDAKRQAGRLEHEARVRPAFGGGAPGRADDSPTTGDAFMQRILVPIDGSEKALAAVRRAATLDNGEGAREVHLLFVRNSWFEPIPRYAGIRARRKFRDAGVELALAPAGELLNRFCVAHAEHIESGGRAAAIRRVAQRVRATRILIGTARKRSLMWLIEGPVIRRLKETAKVPVQTVPGTSMSTLGKCGLPAGVGAAATMVMVAME